MAEEAIIVPGDIATNRSPATTAARRHHRRPGVGVPREAPGGHRARRDLAGHRAATFIACNRPGQRAPWGRGGHEARNGNEQWSRPPAPRASRRDDGQPPPPRQRRSDAEQPERSPGPAALLSRHEAATESRRPFALAELGEVFLGIDQEVRARA